MCALEIRPAVATERLILRAPSPEDAPRMAKLCNDFGVAGMTTNIPHPYALGDAEAFIEAQRQGDRAMSFVVEHRDEGMIGMIGFNAPDPIKPELGYWLGRQYWGQGYATEAAQAALAWARRDWRRKVVVAGHFADNPASGEVLCKAGFLYTGDVELRPSKARGAPAPTRMMVWLA